ncbi:MAG: myxosortase-dependent metalloprotease, MXAN_2677/MXAN_2678 family [Myxococcota bacterium]
MTPAAAFVSALCLAQAPPYVRSRVTNADPDSHCLWWREETNIEFRQHQRGNDETTGDTEFAAVSAAFASWLAVMNGCGSLRFTEGPRTTLTSIGHDPLSESNENIVLFRTRMCTDLVGSSDQCWRDDDCMNQYDCWAYARGTIALTTTVFDPQSGRVLGGDFELNSVSFIFTTVDAPPCVSPVFNQSCVATDVQNTMTHEIGHLLGLDHTPAPGSTMNASAPAGETSKRAIDPGSQQFICDTYPPGKPSRDCVILQADGTLGAAEGGCAGCATAASSPMLLALLAWLRARRKRSA